MIAVCELCEQDLSGQVTTCNECGGEYHLRCWRVVGECKVCREDRKQPNVQKCY
jgi:hypothetical protein